MISKKLETKIFLNKILTPFGGGYVSACTQWEGESGWSGSLCGQRQAATHVGGRGPKASASNKGVGRSRLISVSSSCVLAPQTLPAGDGGGCPRELPALLFAAAALLRELRPRPARGGPAAADRPHPQPPQLVGGPLGGGAGDPGVFPPRPHHQVGQEGRCECMCVWVDGRDPGRSLSPASVSLCKATSYLAPWM